MSFQSACIFYAIFPIRYNCRRVFQQLAIRLTPLYAIFIVIIEKMRVQREALLPRNVAPLVFIKCRAA